MDALEHHAMPMALSASLDRSVTVYLVTLEGLTPLRRLSLHHPVSSALFYRVNERVEIITVDGTNVNRIRAVYDGGTIDNVTDGMTNDFSNSAMNIYMRNDVNFSPSVTTKVTKVFAPPRAPSPKLMHSNSMALAIGNGNGNGNEKKRTLSPTFGQGLETRPWTAPENDFSSPLNFTSEKPGEP